MSDAEDSDNEDAEADKAAAREKVITLKNTLSKLKDNVLKEAAAAKQAARVSSTSDSSSQNTKKITNWIKSIAAKVP